MSYGAEKVSRFFPQTLLYKSKLFCFVILYKIMNLEILYLSFNLVDLVELVVYESNGELWENTTLTSRFSLNKQRNGNN